MKLIQTKNYLLLIDEGAETCEYYLHNSIDGRHQIYSYKGNEDNFKRGQPIKWCSKIIAYCPLTKESKELDLPLLPSFEIDVDELAEVSSEKHHYAFGHQSTIYQLGFLEGFKAAQSKQFELLKRAIQLASDAENIEEVTEEIIQSLSTQQLPKEFVGWLSKKKCPYDFTSRCTIDRCDCEFVFETITNSEGKRELVGTYKY